ncbi:hypothetical protein D6D28_01285 [Aureobasidium pullulans]|uniref:SAM and PH domain-containing protein n=1 Tax=Aureobasidium pullulans TaxID=5580 RepID=A0A4S8SXX7_AURPU|nr:hypothetical protein D6D28_01285 [Aureobasidium pullulans]
MVVKLAMTHAVHVGVQGSQPQTLRTPFSTPSKTSYARPISEATEIYETDVDDDESLFEENSPKPSFDSFDSRRRSQTTVSSFEEALTPRSDIQFERSGPFTVYGKPVEGPKGPHLFRASQSSAEFAFDYALQMSPLFPKTMELPPQATIASPQEFAFSPQDLYVPGLDAVLQSPSPYSIDRWTTEDVLNWMLETGLPHEVVDKFEKHDINGTILVELEFENLKELEIESFGKRHQLWNAIQNLKGGERGPSPVPTPFQDISRPPTNIRSKSDGDIPREALPALSLEDDMTPVTPVRHKKRRGRKNRHHDDIITPAESVSIVAIEQLMPREHNCPKGENCPKWRKQQRLFARIRDQQGWPISPDHGGQILITGDPGNAATAYKVLENVHRHQEASPSTGVATRPVSENMPPSIVASSDLLGPGQLPAFALHENMLSQLQSRDPQENVKQFLNFQHVGQAQVEAPPTPPLDTFPGNAFEMFPPLHQQAYPSLQRPSLTQEPHENLKHLPKLAIPRSASANPWLGMPNVFSPAETIMSPCRSAAASPGGNQIYRHGTPASEMDVPVTAVPLGPISRDTSQSVPPNMQYREHTRTEFRRQPSHQLPALDENAVFSPTTAIQRSPSKLIHVVDKAKQKEMKKAHMQATYGTDVSHAGYMKKRKTKLLRHEWQNAHFRLHGTQLAMHESNRLSALMLDSIDVDDYSVACASTPSNNKITAALKTLKLGDKKKDLDSAAAFSFQLVPSGNDRVKLAHGKTHHFAVTNSNERIDWMRELMLAKALRQKHSGFEVEHNGEKA